MTAWPPYSELRDVTVTPLVDGAAGMTFSADPLSERLQHLRNDGISPAIDIRPITDHLDPVVIEEPVLYAGPLFRDFGHALSESIHRLWPRLAYPDLWRIRVAYHSLNGTRPPPYFVEALNLHGISGKQIMRITGPTRFSHLVVARQGRILAGPTIHPEYRHLLEPNLSLRIATAGAGRKLYISRARHSHTGSFYGESYVETLLSTSGFEIIYPEQHTLNALVAMLRASDLAVFAEGGAIHVLELCGSKAPTVFVIGRRRNSIPRFAPMLAAVTDRWTVSDRVLTNLGMSIDSQKHSGFLDLLAVIEDLRTFVPGLIGEPDAAAAEAGVRKDVEGHILDPRNQFSTSSADMASALRTSIRSPAVGAAFASRIKPPNYRRWV